MTKSMLGKQKENFYELLLFYEVISGEENEHSLDEIKYPRT